MVYKLLNIGKHTGAIRLRLGFAIAIIFLSTKTLGASATEYVFTAPPEVNRQIVEIPPSETEYPLYECSSEKVTKPETATEATDAIEAKNPLDGHDCNCQNCEDTLEESELDPADQP
jgi:hypothetical protein